MAVLSRATKLVTYVDSHLLKTPGIDGRASRRLCTHVEIDNPRLVPLLPDTAQELVFTCYHAPEDVSLVCHFGCHAALGTPRTSYHEWNWELEVANG